MQIIENYINGALVAPISKKYIDNINPSKGQVYSQIPDSDHADVELAVAAAKAAFPAWSTCGIETRAHILNKIADLIDENLEELAKAESIDNGKPLSLAKSVDIPRASSNFRFYASGIQHFAAESHYMEGTAINYTKRSAVGVAGCISPWNLPLYLFSWKIAPALAAGNTVVAKPTEVTPMTAYLLSKLCIEAGLPNGVLNIVHGYGHKAGQAIVEHKDVPLISFTGGTETGKKLAATAAPMFKKLSLELGGKNPNIIFADCDFDDMLKTTLRSSFANQGQICLCGSRIFVERPIYGKFKNAFVEKVKKMKVGDPLNDQTKMGAVVSEAHMNKVLGYIKLAQGEGGTVLAGGDRVMVEGDCADGYFIAPTIIEGLSHDCRTNQEEIFGPVVTIMPFDTEDEVLAMANATSYGLAATIWTQNLKRAHRVSHQVKSGIVWVNCWLLRDLRTPFGGMKQSGVGREGGFEALRFFTEPQNVCIKL
ncbi:aminomuconate-semialdehyde/2-hydroxymuconate-6-semialdehyde dehydrogenase [Reichenbachiella faecimaris]|uniref:Aminomuconate-semialdehyde/2-hydroxymuconate-6-semialdehyde dehydrogenase n=1 Tax=Reichenbachiella faecimaris TaxID=692418 RepID=A0A1W2G7K1_REIFA|nr:aldehyde dehydrogenase [Reichenbachiella faecimaris]SMD32647.1 aminomuconate-semialdehyde/2-hydroxymuconate-6-semialdehyde dehydrogenase [Reichenbachiella faecimaris]